MGMKLASGKRIPVSRDEEREIGEGRSFTMGIGGIARGEPYFLGPIVHRTTLLVRALSITQLGRH